MGVTPDSLDDAAGATDGPLDVAAIRPTDWPRRLLTPPPKGRRPGFQVVFQRAALDAVHAHGKSVTDMEICGLLVGHVYHDEHGPFLHVTAAIEGRHATHHAAQVTFTSATWEYAHEVLERDHADQRIVGWYHTHPDFGVFLSGMDLFIQDNFFNLAWQVALVYDPVREDEGVFVWKDGKSERVDHLVHDGGFLSGADQRPPTVIESLVSAETAPPSDPPRITPPAPQPSELNPIAAGDSRWRRIRRLVSGVVNNIESQWHGQWRDRS